MKKKNQGFTLIELVIAVVILAIAVSPLVANFIQSGKMNLKSRKSLNAMNLAQDIMEGMSQYSVSQNTLFFDKATVSTNALVDKRILPGGTTVGGCSIDAAATDDDHKVYNISGIKTTDGAHNTYDIKVTFDSIGDSSELADINNQPIAEIQGLDKTKDAVYTYTSDLRRQDLSGLAGKTNTPSVTDPDHYAGLVSRLFTINIIKNPDNTYSCDVVRKYTGDSSLGFVTPTDNSYEKSGPVLLPSSSKMPRVFYFYFEGFPGATRPDVASDSQDKIKIVNKTGETFTVYLVRTVDPDHLNLAYNTDYACDVEVEGYKADGITPEDNVDVVSNLRFNLYYEEDNFRKYEEQSTNKLSYLSDDDVARSHYEADRSKIKYNGLTATEDVYKAHIFDGFRTSDQKLLYKVKIEISEPGKSVLATYTGGLSN